jgi:hypothetical protein
MVMLRGTFDDSGDHGEPAQNSASFGGYIGPKSSWDLFEDEWQRVLDKYGVPYLHMKEIMNRNGEFAHLFKDDWSRLNAFYADLANAIGKCKLLGYASVVRTADLAKFNAEFGANIDGYALTLMDLIGNISLHYPGESMDLLLDRTGAGQRKRISAAWDYLASAKTDPERRAYENADTFINVSPLPKELTFRNFRPMQAADFAAWESRKNIIMKDPFFESEIAQTSLNRSFFDYWIWLADKEGEITLPPQGDRKSFRALNQASQIQGSVWDYRALCDEHKSRGGIWEP